MITKINKDLSVGWACPNCGQVARRHGRGGARACHHDSEDGTCRGLECACEDGKCYSKFEGFGWRRSPCPHAVCHHCGWSGQVRSRDFERKYGKARCPKSSSGWHWVSARVEMSQFEPAGIVLVLTCRECGSVGTAVVDPIRQITWNQQKKQEG